MKQPENKRTDIEKTLQKVRGCTVCAPHLPLAPKPIFQADPQARVLIVSQAPGRRAHESGIPFHDRSGERLREWMGISAEVFYSPLIAILPVGMCYPGKGPHGDLPPRPECAEHWSKTLRNLVSEVQITLLIGRYAQQIYLGAACRPTLTATVRAWREYLPDYLPLPHPSWHNTRWLKQNAWFEREVVPCLRRIIISCQRTFSPPRDRSKR